MKPILLVGPQASGKTTRAIELAKKRGKYRVVTAANLSSPFGLSFLAEEKYDALIIEEAETLSSDSIETLTRNTQIRIDRKGKPATTVSIPFLIFTSSDPIVTCYPPRWATVEEFSNG